MNRNGQGEKINHLTLHQGLRSVLTLAAAYSVETLATPVIYLPHKKAKKLFERLICGFTDKGRTAEVDSMQEEFTALLTSVSGEFANTSVKKAVVYPI